MIFDFPILIFGTSLIQALIATTFPPFLFFHIHTFIFSRLLSFLQHTVCTPRLGRKTLEGGIRHEDGVLLVPGCRKLRQEMIRSTCMDPAGAIRPGLRGLRR